MVRHQAALVSGKLTRVPSGVNLPPSEVIMSRLLSSRYPGRTVLWFSFSSPSNTLFPTCDVNLLGLLSRDLRHAVPSDTDP